MHDRTEMLLFGLTLASCGTIMSALALRMIRDPERTVRDMGRVLGGERLPLWARPDVPHSRRFLRRNAAVTLVIAVAVIGIGAAFVVSAFVPLW